jgi:hypothetical protein
MEEDAEGDGRVLYHACVVQAIQTSAFSLVRFVLSPENSLKSLLFFFSIAPRGRRSWVTSAHVFELFTVPGHRTPRTPLLDTEGKK